MHSKRIRAKEAIISSERHQNNFCAYYYVYFCRTFAAKISQSIKLWIVIDPVLFEHLFNQTHHKSLLSLLIHHKVLLFFLR